MNNATFAPGPPARRGSGKGDGLIVAPAAPATDRDGGGPRGIGRRRANRGFQEPLPSGSLGPQQALPHGKPIRRGDQPVRRFVHETDDPPLKCARRKGCRLACH